MKPRHRKLAARCRPLLEPGEQVCFVFGGRSSHPKSRVPPWIGLLVILGLVVLAKVGVSPWILVSLAVASTSIILVTGSQWQTVAVTDRSIVVLRNSNLRARRTPVEVIERLPHGAWNSEAGGAGLNGDCFEVVPTDREQVRALDAAIAGGWPS